MSSIQLSSRTTKRKSVATHKIFGNIAVLILLIVFTLLFIAPFAWLILTALKSPADLDAFPITWLPDHVHWNNFVQAVTLIDYWHFAWNSFALSTIQSVLITATSSLVGFGFARLRGWGKRPLFMLMLSTMMLPSIVGIIPTYILFSQFGLVDTYWPWVLWGLASSPFLSFLFRQFFASIPQELEEAAIVDGCGYGRIFWQIFLPLSKPVIATSMIFAFTGVWGDFLGPTLFLDSDNTTLAVAISHGYADLHGLTLINVLAAGCVLYVLPMLILFFFAQKYFVQGIVTTGLKG
ncbi:carbohydrate ABC transporter permease [Dictyobacter kobayashii]|uniref:Sugar ABC transporter permease n=1 Tax=Dictyobacter kobayashii TaxID=2014872 RepID=A0A402ATC7_9CHLR|nr:carbohydrate ABC transporter permease [Dictyobacter kobayashii]GCE22368.1 sugar ABC transporter permease [Dictyobacter kobayashii]